MIQLLSDIMFKPPILLEELCEMELVDSSANLVYEKEQVIENTFPVLTPDFIASATRLSDSLENRIKGLKVFGRSSGKAFFINDLLVQTYNSLTDYG